MASPVRLSDAAALGLHTMVMLARNPDRQLRTRDVSQMLKVSEAHLAKVLQRLNHAGLVVGERGPHGGYALARPPDAVTLKEVYEVIEGPLTTTTCLLRTPVCGGKDCILSDLMQRMNDQFRGYLSATTLADLNGTPRGGRRSGRKGSAQAAH